MAQTTYRPRVSIRKMGTRRGAPHYGAECQTCGDVLAVAHLSREACQALKERHAEEGCSMTLRAMRSTDRVKFRPGSVL